MYILNHSCKVEDSIIHEFINWVNEYYGQKESEQEELTDYRYSQLCAPVEDDGSKTIIIQAFIEQLNTPFDLYLQEQQSEFQSALFQRFEGKALSFLTLMKVLRRNEQ